jgi:hypothetical protein
MLDTSSNIHTITMIAIPNTSKNICLNLLVRYAPIIVLKRTFVPAVTTRVFQTQNGKYNFQAITIASFCQLCK